MEVFCHGLPSELDHDDSDLSWIGVSHVCRKWRAVALACPELWSSLVFSRPKWTEVMLERSGSCPLSVRVHLDSPELYSRLTAHYDVNCHRLQTLAVAASASLLESFIAEVRYSIVPLLETIIIVSSAVSSDSPGVVLPDDMFINVPNHDGKQRLRHVELSRCAFPWDSRFYSNLTFLALDDIPKLQQPTFAALTRILAACPLLQVLRLSGVDTGQDTNVTRKISLPHLRYVRIKDHRRACSFILGTIGFPTNIPTILDIIALGCPSMSPQYSVHFNFILPTLFCRPLGSVRVLCMLRLVAQSLSMTIDVGSSDSDPDKGRLTRFTTEVSSEHLEAFFKFAVQHMHRSGCKIRSLSLSLKEARRLSVHQLVAFWSNLSVMKDLQDIHIEDAIPGLLLEYMLERTMSRLGIGRPIGYPAEPHGLEPTQAEFLPSLRGIHLHSLRLNADSHLKVMIYTLQDDVRTLVGKGKMDFSSGVKDEIKRLHGIPSVGQVLRAFLWARKVSDLPNITSLTMSDCSQIYTDDLAHLRFFCDVAWDEVGHDPEDRGLDGCESMEEYSVGVYSRMFDSLKFRVETPYESNFQYELGPPLVPAPHWD